VFPTANHCPIEGEIVSRTGFCFVACYLSKLFSSQNRFVELARKTTLPPRRDPTYAESLRKLHSAILGICALMGTTPYSVESWLPPLTEGPYPPSYSVLKLPLPLLFLPQMLMDTLVLAPHSTDPPPISTTIRKCASEFKKVMINQFP